MRPGETPPRSGTAFDSLVERIGTLPWPLLFLVAWVGVVLTHLTLLRLPYFWDEGGYYVPAALDFYHSGTLIPAFSNAHPPLPSVVLGSLWHLFGPGIHVTRLTACAFAAGGLTAVFVLGRRLLGPAGGLVLTLLTAVYPIWFAQSSLAHADIFAAAFSLAGCAVYLTSPELIGSAPENFSQNRCLIWASVLFCLSALSKETAIVQPTALALLQGLLSRRARGSAARAHRRWAMTLLVPIPVLAAWFGYHWVKTGQVFGNPVYLRYNATANFTLAHFLYALRIRAVHLTWQRNLWVPLVLALAAHVLLPPRIPERSRLVGLPRDVTLSIAVLCGTSFIAFSLLGGALLTRYLLPVYPLILLVCVATWRSRTVHWPSLAALSAIGFLSAIWLNPSTFFAPEDNLTYRDMIVVQQEAIDFLNQHYPDATVLTAWPASAELFRPELGYTSRRFRVYSLDNFTTPELAKAAANPGRYDTALLFTTHYTSPAFRRFLLNNPRSWRGRRYAADLDLSPAEIAQRLGGEVVWKADHYGEWAAIVRFGRSYEAQMAVPGSRRRGEINPQQR